MSTLQEQARALGDPTRYAVFRYLVDAREPVGVAELTEHFGLHHNAIRQHLAKLVAADLVSERRASSTGRGRPRLLFGVHPGAPSRWGTAGPYERLSLLLTEALRTGDSPEEVGRRSARSDLGPAATTSDPIEWFVEAMEREGFEPKAIEHGDEVEVVLQACPFETAAIEDPDTICAIHLGLARGVADLTDGRLVIDELQPHDPRRVDCRVRMHVLPED